MREDFDIDSILNEFHAEDNQPQRQPARKPERAQASSDPVNRTEKKTAAAVKNDKEERAVNTVRSEPVHRRGTPRIERELEQRISDTAESKKTAGRRKKASPIVKPIMMVLSCLCLCWGFVNLVPAAGSAASKTARTADTAAAVENTISDNGTEQAEPTANNEISAEDTSAAQEPAATEKPHYTIAADATAGNVPNEACYGSVSIENASEILNVIQQARDSGLLDAEETVYFSPDFDFYYDSEIEYYLDDTILTICWKQVIDGNTCSLVETKIADGSQFRRKFADDAFGAANTYYASDLAKSANAVVAMNADYYLFRDFGMVVYNGELYRYNTGTYTGSYQKYNCVDTCFVTSGGDFLFKKVLEQETEDEVRQFIADNDIVFSIAFGPVLVENYEAQVCDWYPVGEIDRGYSRAGIGQLGNLHYLYMSLNHSPEKEARWTINTFAQHFAETGVINAYCLDGGQTSEIVFRGEPYNYIDYGAERLVSDIIYFATAIPGEG